VTRKLLKENHVTDDTWFTKTWRSTAVQSGRNVQGIISHTTAAFLIVIAFRISIHIQKRLYFRLRILGGNFENGRIAEIEQPAITECI
jgi:hypothetical protein